MKPSEVTLFTAGGIMTTDVVWVRPDTMIQEAVDLFELEQVSGLPVIDDQHRLVGVITEYDLLQSIRTLQLTGKVADFMTTDVTTVSEDVPLVELAEIFLSTHVRRLPVVADGKLVGVVSRRDLLFVGKIRQQLLAELPVFPIIIEEDLATDYQGTFDPAAREPSRRK
jgi:CBS domain-containing protein